MIKQISVFWTVLTILSSTAWAGGISLGKYEGVDDHSKTCHVEVTAYDENVDSAIPTDVAFYNDATFYTNVKKTAQIKSDLAPDDDMKVESTFAEYAGQYVTWGLEGSSGEDKKYEVQIDRFDGSLQTLSVTAPSRFKSLGIRQNTLKICKNLRLTSSMDKPL